MSLFSTFFLSFKCILFSLFVVYCNEIYGQKLFFFSSSFTKYTTLKKLLIDFHIHVFFANAILNKIVLSMNMVCLLKHYILGYYYFLSLLFKHVCESLLVAF